MNFREASKRHKQEVNENPREILKHVIEVQGLRQIQAVQRTSEMAVFLISQLLPKFLRSSLRSLSSLRRVYSTTRNFRETVRKTLVKVRNSERLREPQKGLRNWKHSSAAMAPKSKKNKGNFLIPLLMKLT